MESEITHRPSFTHLTVTLEQGESIVAEPGAMTGFSPEITVNTETSGDGLLDSAKSMLGGESFFTNEFVAEDGQGEVALAPPTPGDVMERELDDETLYTVDGAFLAAETGVDIDSEVEGLNSVLGGVGLTPLALNGSGTVFVDSYGGLGRIDLDQGESYTIDNANLVAWDDTVEFETRRIGGLKSSLLSGEGLVCEFTGPGSAWYQTRDLDGLADVLEPELPNN